MFRWFKKLFSKTALNPLWDSLVVGKIVKVESHPNADRLKICTVDCGKVTRTIVCGGVNVREGMLTAVATPGVKVCAAGSTELVEIKSAVIRGVASDGMLCGPDEILLADRFPMKDKKEIIDLTSVPDARPGVKLAAILR